MAWDPLIWLPFHYLSVSNILRAFTIKSKANPNPNPSQERHSIALIVESGDRCQLQILQIAKVFFAIFLVFS